jgi:hypothetical protein
MREWLLWFAAALAAFLAGELASIVHARAEPAPACNVTPCVVSASFGGLISDFEDLADRLVRTGEPLEIVGDCYSACTILADRARKVVCIDRKVRFRFHQAGMIGGEEMGKRWKYEGYSPELRAWLDAQGGEPEVGWLTMRYAEAKRFWRRCE